MTIGWTYVFAYEQSEKYKEGKFIIERAYMAKGSIPVSQESEEEKELNPDEILQLAENSNLNRIGSFMQNDEKDSDED